MNVCICSGVTDTDIKELINKYPKITNDQVIENLGIGQRCGMCIEIDCCTIDIHYSAVIEKLK